MITVTKPDLPPLEEYVALLETIWQSVHLTNHGPLVTRLERELERFLEAKHVQYLTNGTIALQIGLRALKVTKEVITTPFSYVATTSAILWEHCTPVFADIEPNTFCIDPARVEAAITPRTEAILATHVYGYPCDVEALAAIASRHRLKIIYDGAHAFDVRVGGRPIASFGDLTTLSFHATKLFHTVEGGAIVADDDELMKSIWLLKSFGHIGDEHLTLGINGKASEFHAAMGLCMLPRVRGFIARRKEISALYDSLLAGAPIQRPVPPPNVDYNYAYYPVLFASEAKALAVQSALAAHGIGARRYFFPSLDGLPYVTSAPCPVSNDVARRVLCLPLYNQLGDGDVARVVEIVRRVV
ncbi:MAG: DegT/DnrJ/EryC1/StrS family aminotransferase [Polyangiales bacterium]